MSLRGIPTCPRDVKALLIGGECRGTLFFHFKVYLAPQKCAGLFEPSIRGWSLSKEQKARASWGHRTQASVEYQGQYNYGDVGNRVKTREAEKGQNGQWQDELPADSLDPGLDGLSSGDRMVVSKLIQASGHLWRLPARHCRM